MQQIRLAIIITHPIRYVIPLIQLLTVRKKITLKVFFTFGPELLKSKNYNPEYRKIAEWDLPLFDGYEYEFVENIAKKKSTFSYCGIDNPNLISIIKQWSPTGILVFGWKFKSHLKVLRHFNNKIPIYFRGDSTLLEKEDQSSLKRFLRRITLTWVYKHINKVFYVGTNNKEYYHRFGLKDHQLVYAPHAVDNDRFANFGEAAAKAMMMRKQMKIKVEEIVFLFAGKLYSKKNPELLLNAFLKADLKNTHLIFVGSGNLEAELKRLAGPYTNIHFIPFQTQTMMPVIYRLANILILPSQSETWGLVLNEAMACGLPVIASDKCGSAIDLIEQGKNGYIFKSGDVDQLSGILTFFATHSEQINEMSKYSREKINDFSYKILSPIIEQNIY